MDSRTSRKNESSATPIGESSPHEAQKSGDEVVYFFDKVSDDTLHVILSLLPAKSFAAAACVCQSWNRTASFILSKPKLISAMSILPTLPDAVDEVIDKVLSNNVRPGFVIACFTLEFNALVVHEIVRRRFGSNVPIVTNFVEGVIGVNVELGIYQEPTAENVESEMIEANDGNVEILGFTLIVGWIPDMKAKIVSLNELQSKKENQIQQRDKLCNVIKDFSKSVSGDNCPSSIILFGENHAERKLDLLYNIDQTFSQKTVVAGHFNGQAWYQTPKTEVQFGEIVALVFARDRNKRDGIGETQFHVPLRHCVSQIGPVYTVEFVNDLGKESLVTAKSEDGKIIDGKKMIHKLGMHYVFKNLYIGVEKKTKDESQDDNETLALSLHQVKIDLLKDLTVMGNGIDMEDTFHFYYADMHRGIASLELGDKGRFVVGGLVFVAQSYAVKERCSYQNDYYSKPLLDTLSPGTNVSGMYTTKIVRRGPIDQMYDQNGNSRRPLKSYNNRKGIDYLLISHARAP